MQGKVMSKKDSELSTKLKKTQDRKQLEDLAKLKENPGPLLRGRIHPDGSE